MMQRLLLAPCALLVGLTSESLAVRIGEETHSSVSSSELEERSLLQRRSRGKRHSRNPHKIDDWFLEEHPDAAELEEGHHGDHAHDYDEFEERREGHRHHRSHNDKAGHAAHDDSENPDIRVDHHSHGLTEEDEKEDEESQRVGDGDRDYAADNDYETDYQEEEKKDSEHSERDDKHEEDEGEGEEHEAHHERKDDGIDQWFLDEHPDAARGSGGDQIQEMEERERASQRRHVSKASQSGHALTQDYAQEETEQDATNDETEYDYEDDSPDNSHGSQHGHGHVQWEDSLLDQTSGSEEVKTTASETRVKESLASIHKKAKKKGKSSGRK